MVGVACNPRVAGDLVRIGGTLAFRPANEGAPSFLALFLTLELSSWSWADCVIVAYSAQAGVLSDRANYCASRRKIR